MKVEGYSQSSLLKLFQVMENDLRFFGPESEHMTEHDSVSQKLGHSLGVHFLLLALFILSLYFMQVRFSKYTRGGFRAHLVD